MVIQWLLRRGWVKDAWIGWLFNGGIWCGQWDERRRQAEHIEGEDELDDDEKEKSNELLGR
jgi:hypothetical protein